MKVCKIVHANMDGLAAATAFRPPQVPVHIHTGSAVGGVKSEAFEVGSDKNSDDAGQGEHPKAEDKDADDAGQGEHPKAEVS